MAGHLPDARQARDPEEPEAAEGQARGARRLTRTGPSTDPFRDRTHEARAVLDRNWTGRSTVPATGLYPHQWNWDTGFIAIGRSRYDQPRAEIEMRRLFEGQWRTGMLPHILFDTQAPQQYFPGPDFWQSQRSPDAPKAIATSGITQPPIHAWAVLEMHRRAANPTQSEAFLTEMFPRLAALHDYFRDRRGGAEGLTWFLHPWESGLDNSPAWDEAFHRVKIPEGSLPPYERDDLKHADARDRPTHADYDRFIYLALRYRETGYDDARAAADFPFRVLDPMFNSIWARSAVALAEIAGVIGQDGRRFSEDADATTRAIEERMWSDASERFAPLDALTGARTNHHAIVSLMPVVAPGLSSRYLERMQVVMRGFLHEHHTRAFLCPSYALSEREFSDRRYWRGPIWVNTNWLLYQGVVEHGGHRAAADLRSAVLELVGRFGFREYFDPLGRSGYGTDHFSWTAALYLDLAADQRWRVPD